MNEVMIPTWTLGDRLRKARVSADISTKDMAAALLRHPNTVTNWEGDNTRPTHRVLRRWAEMTHVPTWWLLGADSADSEPASNDRRDTGGITVRYSRQMRASSRVPERRHLALVVGF